MAYDPGQQRVVLFGGSTAYNYGTVFGDTWEWDGSNWTRRLPTSSPGGLYRHVMAHDATRQRTVVYGGNDGNGSSVTGTWE